MFIRVFVLSFFSTFLSFLSVQGRSFPRIGGCSCDVQSVREELIEVRDRVNRLLDLIVPDASNPQKAGSAEDSAQNAMPGMLNKCTCACAYVICS